MTNVYVTNKDNNIQDTPYYIKIYPTKITIDIAANPKPLPKPKGPAKQDADSTTMFIDLQDRTKAVTIQGYIDKYSNRASNWTADAVHDAGVVKLRLERMADRGGLNKIYVGTAVDGYYNISNSSTADNIIEGKILKVSFTETASDHIDKASGTEDYPSATKKIVDKYEIIIQIRAGTTYTKD